MHPFIDHIQRVMVLLCHALLWTSSTAIFLILTINTVLRYASGASLQWANEVPELLFPWLVMAGVVLAAEQGAHIATTFLMDGVPASVRRWIGVAGALVVAVLYSVLAFATARMLPLVHAERSAILQIPGSVTYACVMVGMLMLALLALRTACRMWFETGHTAGSPNPGEPPKPLW